MIVVADKDIGQPILIDVSSADACTGTEILKQPQGCFIRKMMRQVQPRGLLWNPAKTGARRVFQRRRSGLQCPDGIALACLPGYQTKRPDQGHPKASHDSWREHFWISGTAPSWRACCLKCNPRLVSDPWREPACDTFPSMEIHPRTQLWT